MKTLWKNHAILFSRLLVAAGVILVPASKAAPVTWQIEVVDQSGPGKFSSLKIDKNGNAHLAYVVDDGAKYPLKYAFWDHAIKKWFVMNVSDGSGPCSLTLDSKQLPHISYVDYGTMSGSKLRYAHWDGAAWKTQAIPLNSDVIGYYNSIVLDAAGNPSISFYEYRGPKDTEVRIRLRNVTWTGHSWQVRTVDNSEGSGKFNSMAIDPNGNMYLAYANVSANTAGMRFAFWNGSFWNPEIVDGMEQNDGGSVGYSVSIALDKKGNPHVSYMNESSPMVKYATRRPDQKNGQWQVQTVDRISGVAYPDRNSIAVDDDGNPYMGYYDAGRGLLKVAHREGSQWMGEVVDSNASGFSSSMQIEGGTLWISYADDAIGGLKVARRQIGSHEMTSSSQAQAPLAAKQ